MDADHRDSRRSLGRSRSSGATWHAPLAAGLTLGVIVAAVAASLVNALGAAAWLCALIPVAAAMGAALRARRVDDQVGAARWATFAVGLIASPAMLIGVLLVLRTGIVSAPW